MLNLIKIKNTQKSYRREKIIKKIKITKIN